MVQETYKLDASDYDKFIALLRQAGIQAGMTDKKVEELADSIKHVGAQTQATGKEMKQSLGGLNDVVGGLKNQFIGLFAVERAIALGKEIINITGEFQKLNAVLKTSLGSQGAADVAFSRLQKLASELPVSVKALTENFVRLASRGIQATNEQLIRMSDVASALGKDMNQLTEAILDVNNTERWTELGIKVKTTGDKITGTYRGVTIEQAKTEAGALAMVEAFGKLNGVAGASAALMETLPGKLNNLGDASDRLFNTLGSGASGGLGLFVDGLTKMLDAMNKLASGEGSGLDSLITPFGSILYLMGLLNKEQTELVKNTTAYAEAIKDIKLEDARAQLEEYDAALQSVSNKELADRLAFVRSEIARLQEMQVSNNAAFGKHGADALGRYQEELTSLEAATVETSDSQELLAAKVALLKDKIAELTKTKKEDTGQTEADIKANAKRNEQLEETIRLIENANALMVERMKAAGSPTSTAGLFQTPLNVPLGKEEDEIKAAQDKADTLLEIEQTKLLRQQISEEEFLEAKRRILQDGYASELEQAQAEAELYDFRMAKRQQMIDLENQIAFATLQTTAQIVGLFGEEGQAAAQFINQISAVAQSIMRLNELQQASAAATAAAKFTQGAAEVSATGPAAIALLPAWLAVVAGVVGTLSSLTAKGKKKGGYTGSDVLLNDLNGDGATGFVHAKEFVFNDEKTAKHRNFFEAVHSNKIPDSVLQNFYQEVKMGGNGQGTKQAVPVASNVVVKMETERIERAIKNQRMNISVEPSGFIKVVDERQGVLSRLNKEFSIT